MSLLRDTETEEMLRSYEAPLARPRGSIPMRQGLAGRRSEVNAFAAYGDGGENIFIFSGIILYVHTPNELIGVMAHETGHIKAGICPRRVGMEKAMIPMLLSMVVGVAAMIAGAGEVGMVIMGIGPGDAEAPVCTPSPACRNPPPTRSPRKCCWPRTSRRWACITLSSASRDEEAQSAYKIDPLRGTIRSGQDRVCRSAGHGGCLAL